MQRQNQHAENTFSKDQRTQAGISGSESGQALPLSAVYEDVVLKGHIVDSLMLSKVLDRIADLGGKAEIRHLELGTTREEPSSASLRIHAPSAQALQSLLATVAEHGGNLLVRQDCQLQEVDISGAFPEGFYCTSNHATEVRLEGQWISVQGLEMDCGIVVDPASKTARCVAMADAQLGEKIVVGKEGIRVRYPRQKSGELDSFQFMNSEISMEKPKDAIVRRVAADMHRVRSQGGRLLVVGGPAIVHTGAGQYLESMVRQGWVQVLFAGNALATHDLEAAMHGTSLGVDVQSGEITHDGHEHHLRTINTMRRIGSIRAAVDQGVIRTGIMHACIEQGVEFVLCGSIRDDGPLPDVITDMLEAQRRMRRALVGVKHCLMAATTLHSIATGNMLPAEVQVVCADINPSSVIKLADRGSWQTLGVVTDVAPFLRSLLQELEKHPSV